MDKKAINALIFARTLLKKYRHSLISLMPSRFVDEFELLLKDLDDAVEGLEHEL